MEKFSSRFFCRISHMPLANRRQYLLKYPQSVEI